MIKRLTASEALYGFAAWLTTRDEQVILSANHDASIAAQLVDEFCKANNLPSPRRRWTELLIYPKDKGQI